MLRAAPPCARPVQSRASRRSCSALSLESQFDAARAAHPAETLFSERSAHGNGLVSVLAHGPRWRVLRFSSGDAYQSDQGLVLLDDSGSPQPLLAFSYLQAMAAGLAASGSPLRSVLCIGLGAAQLPAFLAHQLPASSCVGAVEVDPLVVRACRDALRLRFDDAPSAAALLAPASAPGRFACRVGDGAASVASLPPGQLDALALDAFDQYGRTPPLLTSFDFLEAAHAALRPGGALVVNCFNGAAGSEPRRALGALAGGAAAAFGAGSRLFTLPVEPPCNLVLLAVKAGGGALERGGLERNAERAAQGWPFDAAELAARAMEVRPMGGDAFQEHQVGDAAALTSSAAATAQTAQEMGTAPKERCRVIS